MGKGSTSMFSWQLSWATLHRATSLHWLSPQRILQKGCPLQWQIWSSECSWIKWACKVGFWILPWHQYWRLINFFDKDWLALQQSYLMTTVLAFLQRKAGFSAPKPLLLFSLRCWDTSSTLVRQHNIPTLVSLRAWWSWWTWWACEECFCNSNKEISSWHSTEHETRFLWLYLVLAIYVLSGTPTGHSQDQVIEWVARTYLRWTWMILVSLVGLEVLAILLLGKRGTKQKGFRKDQPQQHK